MNKLFPGPHERVAVVTPATGRPELLQCMVSVQRQDYPDVEHIVIVDGQSRAAAVNKQVLMLNSSKRPTVLQLPHVTGHSTYNGHRIYGATAFLTDAPWITFLDEDNWVDKEHVSSLMRLIARFGLDWAYSLRKIVSSNGKFICEDNCNSLGWWPSYDGGYHHIDTNCYLMRRSHAIASAHLWNRRVNEAHLDTSDRALCMFLLKNYPHAFTTGRYSVNYRIGSTHVEGNDRKFYVYGNRINSHFFRRFPWRGLRLCGRLKEHPRLAWEIALQSPAFKTMYREVKSTISRSDFERSG